MTQQIFLQHVVGWCPVCGIEILDSGYDDDPEHWEHGVALLPMDERTINGD